MKRFKVGIQLFSLRDAMAKDMDATLKAVKEMGYDCVEFAGYFGKTVAELNAWECTLLAGLPNAPSAYAPNKHPELALQRQTQVLNAMVKYDFITQKQAKEILQQCPENFFKK